MMLSKNEKKVLEELKKISSIDISTIKGELKTGSRITVECNNGHLIESVVRTLIRTGRCMRCETLINYYKSIDMLKSYEFTVLSSEDSYINSKSDIKYMCTEGHIQYHNVNYFKRSHKCSHCFKYKSFYKIVKELEEEGYTVLTTEDNYTGAKMKVRYVCDRGHSHASYVSDLLQGQRCGKCKGFRLRKLKRIPKEDVVETFKEDGYAILNMNIAYENGSTIFSVRCPNNHTYDTTVANFRIGYRCKRCAYDNNTGELNYGWKGGITPLHNRMRERINPWKQDSMKHNKYRCFISGAKRELVVHHAVNFSDILSETLQELNYEIRSKVNEYSDYELKRIEDVCLQKHYDYGLGVVMAEGIHILFHSIYGTKNNTMRQVLEFKNDYDSGKYPESTCT